MMQRPSPALAALTLFWIAYAITAAVALYQALPGVNRDLFLILGGSTALLVVGTFALIWRDHARLTRTDGSDR